MIKKFISEGSYIIYVVVIDIIVKVDWFRMFVRTHVVAVVVVIVVVIVAIVVTVVDDKV